MPSVTSRERGLTSTGVLLVSADMTARVASDPAIDPGGLGTSWSIGHTGAVTVVRETHLPGVGVKHDFTTEDGRDVAVLVHRDGRRDIVVYDSVDPDRSAMQVTMSSGDTRTLAELLGTSQVNTAVQAVQQEIEGLTIEWLTIGADSPAADHTIGDGAFRTRTGVSVVAVIRDVTPFPAPEPTFTLLADDVVVCVGTIDGLARMRDLIASG